MNKTQYLIFIDPQHPELGLRAGSREEYKAIIAQNANLPANQKRKFIYDKISEYGHTDEMYIEAPRSEYRKWKADAKRRARCYEGVENYVFLSLEALISIEYKEDGVCLKEQVSDEEQLVNEVEDKLLHEDLIRDLQAWKPWAVDLYTFYSNGEKTHCTKPMAKKYHCSDRAMQRNKHAFEHHVNLFMKQYNKDCLFKEEIDA